VLWRYDEITCLSAYIITQQLQYEPLASSQTFLSHLSYYYGDCGHMINSGAYCYCYSSHIMGRQHILCAMSDDSILVDNMVR